MNATEWTVILYQTRPFKYVYLVTRWVGDERQILSELFISEDEAKAEAKRLNTEGLRNGQKIID